MNTHGLLDSEGGYKFEVEHGELAVGAQTTLNLKVMNPDGNVQKEFVPEQTKLMHVYVIRKDTSNYQHLHPDLNDGVFSLPVVFGAPGPHRVFAEFVAKDSKGKKHELTLSKSLDVPGEYEPVPLPPSSLETTVDGYAVTFEGKMRARKGSGLSATITKDGQPVTNLEPYLGTFAHLTAFKADTLAVTHVHPQTAASGGNGGPALTFMTEFPESGDYRMFLQFQTAGELHTAALTYHVD